MKKVIAAVVFMLLVAVFAPFGASDVAFANDGKTMPPKNLPSESVTGIII